MDPQPSILPCKAASFLTVPGGSQARSHSFQALGPDSPSGDGGEFPGTDSSGRRFTWNDLTSFLKNKDHPYQQGRVEMILEFRTGPEKWCLLITLIIVLCVISFFLVFGAYKGFFISRKE